MLRWPAAGALQAALGALRAGEPVEIELPLETHYALYRHLYPDAAPGPLERVEAEGGAELLGRIATIAGLEDLKDLQSAVRRARYQVRIASPQPVVLRLEPPARARKAPSAR
jgi:hypothetical protein